MPPSFRPRQTPTIKNLAPYASFARYRYTSDAIEPTHSRAYVDPPAEPVAGKRGQDRADDGPTLAESRILLGEFNGLASAAVSRVGPPFRRPLKRTPRAQQRHAGQARTQASAALCIAPGRLRPVAGPLRPVPGIAPRGDESHSAVSQISIPRCGSFSDVAFAVCRRQVNVVETSR